MNLIGLFTWLWNHKNVLAYVVLALVIAFLSWKNNRLSTANETMTIERGKLPDNIEFIAELKGTNFKVTYRDSKNNVVNKQYYIPKEGGVKFTKYIDLKQYDPNAGFNGKVVENAIKITNPISNFLNSVFGPKNENKGSVIDVKWYGFTFRPGIAGVYHGGYNESKPVNIAIDAKLFYMNRYSLGIGSSMEYPYVWGSRHIDDLIPFIPVENLEIMGGYAKPYADFSGSLFLLGGRTNF